MRLNQFEMQRGIKRSHPTVASGQTLVKTSLGDSLPQLSPQCAFAVHRRGRCSELLSWLLSSLPSPRMFVLWLATFTLTMQPHPLPCIPFTIQLHFQRILKHNTFYFSVLVKIYEGTKCIPAGNYSPLENAFTVGWNLIRRQSESLRGSQPSILLFQCSNHPNLGTQYFLTCEGLLLCCNIWHSQIFSRTTALDLARTGLDRTYLPAVLLTWEAFHCCSTALSDLLEANKSSCFSLHVTTTFATSRLDQDCHLTLTSRLYAV